MGANLINTVQETCAKKRTQLTYAVDVRSGREHIMINYCEFIVVCSCIKHL